MRSRLFCHMTKTQNFNLDTKTLKKEINFFRPDSTVAAVPKIYTTATFFFHFWFDEKKKFKVLTHEFDDAWLIFFFSDKNLSKKSFFIEHMFYFLIRLCTVGLWIWIFRYWNSLFKIQKGGNFKMLFCCFVHNIYTITQYFTLLSLLCAHLICTYYT